MAHRSAGRVAGGVVVLIGAAACVVLIVWTLPALLTRHPAVVGAERLTAVSSARTGLVALLVAFGAIGGLGYTVRTYGLSRRGQIADRYTKAVDQLANTRASVRTGGLYALGRIANDAPNEYRDMVIDVLISYIHDYSPWPPSVTVDEPGANGADADLIRPDVQVSVALLGDLLRTSARKHIDLQRTKLIGADLMHMCLVEARLNGANLTGAKLNDADLTGADLRGSDLTRVQWVNTVVNDAIMWSTNRSEDLTGARGRDSIQWVEPPVSDDA